MICFHTLKRDLWVYINIIYVNIRIHQYVYIYIYKCQIYTPSPPCLTPPPHARHRGPSCKLREGQMAAFVARRRAPGLLPGKFPTKPRQRRHTGKLPLFFVFGVVVVVVFFLVFFWVGKKRCGFFRKEGNSQKRV